jgi:hypothetical protein
MTSQSFPVLVAVKRGDGSIENVRVGTAYREEEGFRLTLGELSIGAVADVAPARRSPSYGSSPSPSASSGGGAPSGMVFPPYGRSKGAPIAGATRGDLEFYANGCRRTLSDPAKSRWHDKERALLAAIEAELANNADGDGGGGYSPRGGGGDWDAPPSRGEYDGPPARAAADEDIPF